MPWNKNKNPEIQKILIIQLRQFGDVLMTTPLVRQMRSLYPQAQIHFLTEKLGSNVFACNKNVDEVITISRDTKGLSLIKLFFRIYKKKYDLVIDCFCNPKSAEICFFSRAPQRIGFDFFWRKYAYTKTIHHEVVDEYSAVSKLRLIQHLGGNLTDHDIELPISDDIQHFAKKFADQYLSIHLKPVIAFNVISRRDYKIWDYREYIDLANRLVKKGYVIFFVYGPAEMEMAKRVYDGMDVGAQTSAVIEYPAISLLQMRAVLGFCSFYVGNDGGLKHLAVCAGLSTFTIFQNINWANWTPPKSKKHHAITNCLKEGVVSSYYDEKSFCYVNLKADTVMEKIEACGILEKKE